MSKVTNTQPRLVIKYEYITPGADTICGEHAIPMPACGLHPRQASSASLRLSSAFRALELVMNVPHSEYDFVDHEWTPEQGRMLTRARDKGVSSVDLLELVQKVKDGQDEDAAIQRLARKRA